MGPTLWLIKLMSGKDQLFVSFLKKIPFPEISLQETEGTETSARYLKRIILNIWRQGQHGPTRGRTGLWGTPFSQLPLPEGREEQEEVPRNRSLVPCLFKDPHTGLELILLHGSTSWSHLGRVLCCDLPTVYFEGVFMPLLLKKIREQKLP